MSVLSTLGTVLPPPNYLMMPSVGVDISDTSLKYIHFEPRYGKTASLRLKHWGELPIPAGVIQRGVVSDPARLTDVLREVRTRTGMQHVRLSLPEERAYLFQTEVKRGTPFKQIRGLLEFSLEENVPLSPRDAFFDYDLIDDPDRPDTLLVAVTAYARDTIMSYYDVCRAAGVLPCAFEVEAQAIARSAIAPSNGHTYLILDFGKTRTGIGIAYKNILMYTSTIDIGGNDLSAALQTVIGTQTEDEYTKIKNEQGLVRYTQTPEVHEALSAVMQKIVGEIQTRVQYWNTHNEDPKYAITGAVLCGGSVNLRGLPAYLYEQLGIEARRADVWRNAFSIEETIPEITQRYSYGYATAVGLALSQFV